MMLEKVLSQILLTGIYRLHKWNRIPIAFPLDFQAFASTNGLPYRLADSIYQYLMARPYYKELTLEYNPTKWRVPSNWDVVDFCALYAMIYTFSMWLAWVKHSNLLTASMEDIYASIQKWGLSYIDVPFDVETLAPGEDPFFPDGATIGSIGSYADWTPRVMIGNTADYEAWAYSGISYVQTPQSTRLSVAIYHLMKNKTTGNFEQIAIVCSSGVTTDTDDIHFSWLYPDPEGGDYLRDEENIAISSTVTPQYQGVLADGVTRCEILDGVITFSTFGEMTGTITIAGASGVQGDAITIQKGDQVVAQGIITGIIEDVATGINTIHIADPVTASGGKAVYSSGNAITALQEAIENAGGTFSTSMTTSETVFYPGEEQDFWQFARCVCYAVGGVLQYTCEGIYRLLPYANEHTITDDVIIADDAPTIEEAPSEYANAVVASVDASWTEETSATTTETYSLGDVTHTIVRIGEQVQSEKITFGDAETHITYSYNPEGYMVQKTITEEGAGLGAIKKQSEITWSSIQNDGNKYDVSEIHEEWTYCKLYNNDSGTFYSTWVPISKVTREWKVDMGGIATYTEEIWGKDPLFAGNPNISTDLYPKLGELVPQYKYVGAVIVDPEAGPLAGKGSAKKYAYTHNGFDDAGGYVTGTVGWVGQGAEERQASFPQLEKAQQVETKSVRCVCEAHDAASMQYMGKIQYDAEAIALATDSGVQAFAKGVLREKARVKHAEISISADLVVSPHDHITWRWEKWHVDSATINLERHATTLRISTTSSIYRLQRGMSQIPTTWVSDIKQAILKRSRINENVAKGKVVACSGRNRYIVMLG